MGRPAPPSPPPPPQVYCDLRVRELLKAGGELIHEKFGNWVIKHACGTKVTKVRNSPSFPGEAEAVRFVAKHTMIPVPYVHDDREQHITMDFVEGQTLEVAWKDDFPESDKALVRRQLKDHIGQLTLFQRHPAKPSA